MSSILNIELLVLDVSCVFESCHWKEVTVKKQNHNHVSHDILINFGVKNIAAVQRQWHPL